MSIKRPENKAIMLMALSIIAIWSIYSGDKVTLATIVGAFIGFLKAD